MSLRIPTLQQVKEHYIVSEEIDQFCDYLLNYITNQIDEISILEGQTPCEDYEFIMNNWYQILMTCNLKLAEQLIYISLIDFGEFFYWNLYVI